MKVIYGSSLPIEDDSNLGPGRRPRMFRESLCRFNISAENIALCMVYSDPRSHNKREVAWPMIERALSACNPSEIVLATDGWDAFFASGAREIETKFRAMDVPIVFSTELVLWPNELQKLGSYPTSPTRWRYINGGGWMGYAGKLLDFWKRCWIETDPGYECEWSNQHAANLRAIHYPEEFIGCLDHHCQIFQTLAYEGWKVVQPRNHRIYNTETETWPCVIHGQGGHAKVALRLWDQTK